MCHWVIASQANTFAVPVRQCLLNGSILYRLFHWFPNKTAVIVGDMWERHWCKGATSRVQEMAPKMNDLITFLRKSGLFIIHSPSKGMNHYEGTPMRIRAQKAPAALPRVPLKKWQVVDVSRGEPSLPIDDSDGGCDCQSQCVRETEERHRSYLQAPAIHIAEEDVVAEGNEVYNVMCERGICNMLIMGVHANMCILSRTFGIRQMIYQGQNVVLVRDMTDSMYNSRGAPFVSHSEGTQLIIEHIEKYWCPTTTSSNLIDQNLELVQ